MKRRVEFGRRFGRFSWRVVLLIVIAFSIGLRLRAQDTPPPVPPPAPVVLPVPVVRVLPNGLTVGVLERHTVPLITMQVAIETGAEADPRDLQGTASVVADLLSEGTRTRSALDIAQTVDQAGGNLETEATWDESVERLTVLSKYAPLAFDLLSDMTRNPAFAPGEFARIRRQLLSALDVGRTDPTYLADNVLRVMLYAGTPYGHPLDGTTESVERIKPETLKAFHAAYYRPSNAIVLVVGDISADDAFNLATRYFGDWKAAPPPPIAEATPPPPERSIIVIEDPDAVQTEIRVGSLAVPRSSPEFDALTIADQVLGGPAANRLFNALRTERGLTYGASSKLESYRALGGWIASTSTRTSETAESVRVMLEQIRGMQNGSVKPYELATSQSFLIGHQALEFESYDDLAEKFLELMIYGLPLDEWNSFSRRVRTIPAKEVSRMAHQYLDPASEQIVLVGNSEAFAKDLEKLGPVRIIPLARLDLGSPTLERAANAGGGANNPSASHPSK